LRYHRLGKVTSTTLDASVPMLTRTPLFVE
jgi:hypothetical protein